MSKEIDTSKQNSSLLTALNPDFAKSLSIARVAPDDTGIATTLLKCERKQRAIDRTSVSAL